LQENLALKGMIDDPTSRPEGTDAHPVTHQSQRIESLTKELEKTKNRLATTLNQVTDFKRALSPDPNATYNYPETAERQALLEAVDAELRDSRALLRHALLGVDALQREDSAIRASTEFKLVRQQIARVQSAKDSESEGVSKAVATAIADRIESVRGSLMERTRMLAEKGNEVDELRAELERTKTAAPATAPVSEAHAPMPTTDKALRQQLDQLRRENKLMASAWYDMTTRLQSNTVHLSRRAEGGRSWLGRMRTAVNH
jgi:protein HOOK3